MNADSVDTLAALPLGQKARVQRFSLAPESRQRLQEMGLTVGTEFTVVRFAPLGDPLEIKVRGYHLSLRKADAAGIEVVRV